MKRPNGIENVRSCCDRAERGTKKKGAFSWSSAAGFGGAGLEGGPTLGRSSVRGPDSDEGWRGGVKGRDMAGWDGTGTESNHLNSLAEGHEDAKDLLSPNIIARLDSKVPSMRERGV